MIRDKHVRIYLNYNFTFMCTSVPTCAHARSGPHVRNDLRARSGLLG